MKAYRFLRGLILADRMFNPRLDPSSFRFVNDPNPVFTDDEVVQLRRRMIEVYFWLEDPVPYVEWYVYNRLDTEAYYH